LTGSLLFSVGLLGCWVVGLLGDFVEILVVFVVDFKAHQEISMLKVCVEFVAFLSEMVKCQVLQYRYLGYRLFTSVSDDFKDVITFAIVRFDVTFIQLLLEVTKQ